jgi:hypothetical protein
MHVQGHGAQPLVRTLFSVSSLVLSMELGARVLAWTGGANGNVATFSVVAASAFAAFCATPARRERRRAVDPPVAAAHLGPGVLWGAPNYFIGAFVAASPCGPCRR